MLAQNVVDLVDFLATTLHLNVQHVATARERTVRALRGMTTSDHVGLELRRRTSVHSPESRRSARRVLPPPETCHAAQRRRWDRWRGRRRRTAEGILSRCLFLTVCRRKYRPAPRLAPVADAHAPARARDRPCANHVVHSPKGLPPPRRREPSAAAACADGLAEDVEAPSPDLTFLISTVGHRFALSRCRRGRRPRLLRTRQFRPRITFCWTRRSVFTDCSLQVELCKLRTTSA